MQNGVIIKEKYAVSTQFDPRKNFGKKYYAKLNSWNNLDFNLT